jgi:hypothetical protein
MNKFGRAKFGVSIIGIPLCSKQEFGMYHFILWPILMRKSGLAERYSTRLEHLIGIFQYTSLSLLKKICNAFQSY